MNQGEKPTSDPKAVLSRMKGKKSESKYHKDQTLYSQGDPADCVFHIQTGKAKVTVVSPTGKEAVVGILQPGDFCGEECLAGHKLRVATVTALTECVLVRLEKTGVVRALHEDPAF